MQNRTKTCAKRRGRGFKAILGDGNCFCRSIAYILLGDVHKHELVRSDVVDVYVKRYHELIRMIGSETRIRSLLPLDVVSPNKTTQQLVIDYGHQIRRIHTWMGSDLDVETVSNIYKINMHVWVYIAESDSLLATPPTNTHNDRQNIHVLLTQIGSHPHFGIRDYVHYDAFMYDTNGTSIDWRAESNSLSKHSKLIAAKNSRTTVNISTHNCTTNNTTDHIDAQGSKKNKKSVPRTKRTKRGSKKIKRSVPRTKRTKRSASKLELATDLQATRNDFNPNDYDHKTRGIENVLVKDKDQIITNENAGVMNTFTQQNNTNNYVNTAMYAAPGAVQPRPTTQGQLQQQPQEVHAQKTLITSHKRQPQQQPKYSRQLNRLNTTSWSDHTWSDYTNELHRFARYKSISERRGAALKHHDPSGRLQGVKLDEQRRKREQKKRSSLTGKKRDRDFEAQEPNGKRRKLMQWSNEWVVLCRMKTVRKLAKHSEEHSFKVDAMEMTKTLMGLMCQRFDAAQKDFELRKGKADWSVGVLIDINRHTKIKDLAPRSRVKSNNPSTIRLILVKKKCKDMRSIDVTCHYDNQVRKEDVLCSLDVEKGVNGVDIKRLIISELRVSRGITVNISELRLSRMIERKERDRGNATNYYVWNIMNSRTQLGLHTKCERMLCEIGPNNGLNNEEYGNKGSRGSCLIFVYRMVATTQNHRQYEPRRTMHLTNRERCTLTSLTKRLLKQLQEIDGDFDVEVMCKTRDSSRWQKLS
eukprot:507736_1